ncbi:MAG: hypothetical protein ACOZNI_00845 [Myxococcota bacterium]
MAARDTSSSTFTGLIYVADTGTSRIFRGDPSTAAYDRDLVATNEPLEEYS